MGTRYPQDRQDYRNDFLQTTGFPNEVSLPRPRGIPSPRQPAPPPPDVNPGWGSPDPSNSLSPAIGRNAARLLRRYAGRAGFLGVYMDWALEKSGIYARYMPFMLAEGQDAQPEQIGGYTKSCSTPSAMGPEWTDCGLWLEPDWRYESCWTNGNVYTGSWCPNGSMADIEGQTAAYVQVYQMGKKWQGAGWIRFQQKIASMKRTGSVGSYTPAVEAKPPTFTVIPSVQLDPLADPLPDMALLPNIAPQIVGNPLDGFAMPQPLPWSWRSLSPSVQPYSPTVPRVRAVPRVVSPPGVAQPVVKVTPVTGTAPSGPTINIRPPGSTGGGGSGSGRGDGRHRNRKPDRKTRERKFKAGKGFHALMRGLNLITEGVDAVNALWDALPVWRKTMEKGKATSPQQKFLDLFNAYASMSQEEWARYIPDAAQNLVLEQAQDYFYGQIGRISAASSGNWFDTRRGWQTGRWDNALASDFYHYNSDAHDGGFSSEAHN